MIRLKTGARALHLHFEIDGSSFHSDPEIMIQMIA
jgi:hypothetical protein